MVCLPQLCVCGGSGLLWCQFICNTASYRPNQGLTVKPTTDLFSLFFYYSQDSKFSPGTFILNWSLSSLKLSLYTVFILNYYVMYYQFIFIESGQLLNKWDPVFCFSATFYIAQHSVIWQEICYFSLQVAAGIMGHAVLLFRYTIIVTNTIAVGYRLYTAIKRWR